MARKFTTPLFEVEVNICKVNLITASKCSLKSSLILAEKGPLKRAGLEFALWFLTSIICKPGPLTGTNEHVVTSSLMSEKFTGVESVPLVQDPVIFLHSKLTSTFEVTILTSLILWSC